MLGQPDPKPDIGRDRDVKTGPVPTTANSKAAVGTPNNASSSGAIPEVIAVLRDDFGKIRTMVPTMAEWSDTSNMTPAPRFSPTSRLT